MFERVLALAVVIGGLLALAAWGLPQDADGPEEETTPTRSPLRALPFQSEPTGDDDRDDKDDDERDDKDDDERDDEKKKGEEKKRGKEGGTRGRG